MSDVLISVLIVEDHADIAQSMALLLGLHGCRVNIAQAGTEALELAASDPPDLVLLDIGLPGMNGWELARQLRDRAPGKQPVIVALTGYGQYEDRLRSADAGVDLHLVKPADPGLLVDILRRFRQAIVQA